MIRLPQRLFDQHRLDHFLHDVDYVRHWIAGDFLILDILFEEVGIDDDDGWDDGESWLSMLVPLRADLIAGDLRLLYLLWLTTFENDALGEDRPEPMPGIGPLTGALEAFVEFFHLDAHLVAAAAERPATTVPGPIPEAATRKVIATLPDDEKTNLLARIAGGDPNAVSELQTGVRQRLESTRQAPKATPRTAGELRALATKAGLVREQEAAARETALREQRQRELEVARQERLAAIRQKGKQVWNEIVAEIERHNASGYDRAAKLLFDLQVIAMEDGAVDEVRQRLHIVRERHASKRRFIERLEGLP